MTTFISPKPHEKATWHAAARRNIAAMRAAVEAQDAEALLAFDTRQDARDTRAHAKAVATGHTHSICSCCGTRRTLAWAKGPCNEFSADTDDQMCPGTYRAAGGAQ